jgi:hypothetical protein
MKENVKGHWNKWNIVQEGNICIDTPKVVPCMKENIRGHWNKWNIMQEAEYIYGYPLS